MFNTLKYAKMLEEVGFSREQSEATIHILVDVMEDKLATKSDLQQQQRELRQEMQTMGQELRSEMQTLGHELRSEMQTLGQELRSEMQGLRQEVRQDIQEFRQSTQLMKSELIIKMGAMQAASIALVVALIKLL